MERNENFVTKLREKLSPSGPQLLRADLINQGPAAYILSSFSLFIGFTMVFYWFP